MKKYLLAAAGLVTGAVAAAVLTAPATAGAATPAAAPAASASAVKPAAAQAAPASASASAPTRIHVVRSGERVDAGKGYTIWLTADGKHWSGPDGFENFRSVVDGNIDPSAPGVSRQTEGDATGMFHSGLYYGTKTAGRVELSDPQGHLTRATLVELPGRPGWGVWYAHTAAPTPVKGDFGVKLYDRGGRLLAELPATTSHS